MFNLTTRIRHTARTIAHEIHLARDAWTTAGVLIETDDAMCDITIPPSVPNL